MLVFIDKDTKKRTLNVENTKNHSNPVVSSFRTFEFSCLTLEAMFPAGEVAAANFLAILSNGLRNDVFQIGVCFGMPRHSAGAQSEQVVKD
jgi:hypothetical protein